MNHQAKPLEELKVDEFMALKKAGVLKSIYPTAPDNFSELSGVRPSPKKNPNFSSLIRLCEEYLQHKEDPKKYYMKDAVHCIFETAIECVYGDNKESGVWDFVNSKNC